MPSGIGRDAAVEAAERAAGLAAALRVGTAPGRAGPGEPDADRGPRPASAPAAGGRTPCPTRGARGGARTQPRKDGRHDRRRGERIGLVAPVGSGRWTNREAGRDATRRTPAARSEGAIRARQPHRQRRGRTPRRGQPLESANRHTLERISPRQPLPGGARRHRVAYADVSRPAPNGAGALRWWRCRRGRRFP